MEQECPQSLLCERCRSLCPIDPRILHSNYVPSTIEVSQMIKLLEEETKELDECETEMAYLRPRLDHWIEARKQLLETHIKRRRSIISAQRKLPVELWENIFAIVCSSSSHDGCSLSLRYPNTLVMTPIILTHVCSRWRVIVTGCPRLWASIYVDVYMRHVNGVQRLLETFLANSGTFSLDLHIYLVHNALTTTQSRATWDILTRHVSRSKQLLLAIINVGGDSFQGRDVRFNDLLSFVGENVYPRNIQVDINNPFWKALRQAPKLTKVQLNSVWPLNSLPYSQLTTFTINLVYLDEVGNLLQVLEVSVNLRSLHLYFEYRHDGDRPTLDIVPHRVEVPSLRTLIIIHKMDTPIDDPFLDLFFSNLIMPGLLALELTCRSSCENMTRWPSSLLTMLRHSSATLSVMSLSLAPFNSRTPNYSWDSFSILLATVPHLTHFDFYDIGPTILAKNDSLPSDSLPNELTYVPHEGPILPELETVFIQGIRLNSDMVKQILDLAASRSPSRLPAACDVRPLKKLHVVPSGWSLGYILEPRELEAIDGLEQEGVKVVIEEWSVKCSPRKGNPLHSGGP